MDQAADAARLFYGIMATVDYVPPASPGDDQALWKSITNATTEEQAFTQRVVNHAAHIRESTQEIQSWAWTGDFAVPHDLLSPAHLRQASTGAPDTSVIASTTHWGCMRADQVLSYQTRVDQIQAELSNNDLDHQRAHIREIYVDPKTRITHNALSISTTFAIMATIPRQAQLKQLLATWSARLDVLYRTPAFAEEIERAAGALSEAWLAIGLRRDGIAGLRRARTIRLGLHGMFRGTYNQLRSTLEAEVAGVWSSVDNMRKILAEYSEQLPQSWIDLVEGLERDYSDWAFEAEKKVLRYEFRIEDSPSAPAAVEDSPASPRHLRRPSPKIMIPGSWRDSMFNPYDDKLDPLPIHPALSGISDQTPLRPSTAHGATPTDVIRAHVRRHVAYSSLREEAASASASASPAEDDPPVPALVSASSSDDDYTSVYDDSSSSSDAPDSPAASFEDAPEIPQRSPLRRPPPARTCVFTEQTEDTEPANATVAPPLPPVPPAPPSSFKPVKVASPDQRSIGAASTASKKRRLLSLRGLGRAKFWKGS